MGETVGREAGDGAGGECATRPQDLPEEDDDSRRTTTAVEESGGDGRLATDDGLPPPPVTRPMVFRRWTT